MNELVLDCPPSDAREVVQTGFESTREIRSYHDDGTRIVGKTGTSMFSTSWGEEVRAEFRDADGGRTAVELTAEPILGTNVLADPERYRDRVAEECERIRERDDSATFARETTRTKRVPRADLQRGIIAGGKNYTVRRAMAMILAFVFLLVVLAAI